MKSKSWQRIAGALRWTGRITGTLMVAVILLFAIGEGLPNPFTQPLNVQLGFLGLGLLMAGIAAAWRWELTGGMMSLGGWACFVSAALGSPWRITFFIALLALPGVLCVSSAMIRRWLTPAAQNHK